MAKVAFVQFLFMHILGPMHLSAVLKTKGYKCVMVIGDEKHILCKLKDEKPDIIAFSATANEKRWVIHMAGQIKKKIADKTPIIIGGPLATFSPEIIDNPFIDVICRGEGEAALLEFVHAVETRSDKTKIKNLWIKQDGRIFRNGLRPLTRELDEMEFPDRDLYNEYPFIRNEPISRVMATRGCPYSCSFCFESAYRKLYEDVGYEIRKRSAGNIIEELGILKKRHGKRQIWFIDDLFSLQDKQWLKELMGRYSQEIALPFNCHTRIDLIDEEIAGILKGSGFCAGVSFGIETGNEDYRRNVLKKVIYDSQIKKGAAILKRHKLVFSTTNMIGLPGERIEEALSTVMLNREIAPSFSVCTVYQPLPKTELSELAFRRRYIKEKNLSRALLSSHEGSLLEQEDIRELVNLHKFYYVIFYMPWLAPLVKLLVKLPNNILYNMLYKASYLVFYMSRMHNFKLKRLFQEGIVGFRHYRDRW